MWNDGERRFEWEWLWRKEGERKLTEDERWLDDRHKMAALHTPIRQQREETRVAPFQCSYRC
jgi:hypothetical protein